MATLGTGAKKESTEWDDILKQKGIIPEKTPDELAEEQLKAVVEETVETYDPNENKALEQLDEDLEDADSDEEAILESYRQRRLQEMRAEALKVKYGPGVRFLSAADWKAEVTEAPAGVSVVVHLFQSYVEDCQVMDDRLLELSAKFRTTKFVKCKANDAVKNYPDSKCPTLLVYKGGKVLKQFVSLSAFSTKLPTADDIEWALSKVGAIESEMTEPPRPKTQRLNVLRV